MGINSPSEKSRIGILLIMHDCGMENFIIMLTPERDLFFFMFFGEKVQANRNYICTT